MKCTNCLRKRFTKINLHQNYRICKVKNKKLLPLTKKNLTLWTKNNNIEKWCEDIYDAETLDGMEINGNTIIKELQNLKL